MRRTFYVCDVYTYVYAEKQGLYWNLSWAVEETKCQTLSYPPFFE